mmetsp:Transcript_44938/g.114363  ORF Transcript_44938/g.114363 Transcript_44938/m.114363 type:complete len:453 (+) Transcript_44938:20-1378(+)
MIKARCPSTFFTTANQIARALRPRRGCPKDLLVERFQAFRGWPAAGACKRTCADMPRSRLHGHPLPNSRSLAREALSKGAARLPRRCRRSKPPLGLLDRHNNGKRRAPELRALVDRRCPHLEQRITMCREEVASQAEQANGHLSVEGVTTAQPGRHKVDNRAEKGSTHIPHLADLDGLQASAHGQEHFTATTKEAADQGSGDGIGEVGRARDQLFSSHCLSGQLQAAYHLLRFEYVQEELEHHGAGACVHDLCQSIRDKGDVVRNIPRCDEHPCEGLLHERHRRASHEQRREEAAPECRDARGHESFGPIEAGDLVLIVLGNLQEEAEGRDLPSPRLPVRQSQQWLEAQTLRAEVRHGGADDGPRGEVNFGRFLRSMFVRRPLCFPGEHESRNDLAKDRGPRCADSCVHSEMLNGVQQVMIDVEDGHAGNYHEVHQNVNRVADSCYCEERCR